MVKASLKLIIFLIFIYSLGVQSKPVNFEKSWEFANYLYTKGLYLEAEEEALKALSKKKSMKFIDRNYVNLLLLQARSLQKLYRFKEANRVISRTEGYIKILTRKGLRVDATVLVCDYLLDERNIIGAEGIFKEYIQDSLIRDQISTREDADILCVKGKLEMHKGYPKDAIPLLKKVVEFFNNSSSRGVKYFANERLNEELYLEKYADASLSLAYAQLAFGDLTDAEATLKSLITWTKSHLNKENPYRHKPWKLLGELYDKRKSEEEALHAYTNAYTENPHHDNESEKQEALLTCVVRYNNIGRNLEAKDYLRRLEMKASRNMGAVDPSQIAYELAICNQLFLNQEYRIALNRLTKLEKSFSYLPDEHPYHLLILQFRKSNFYYQGNITAYISVLQRIMKLKVKSLSHDYPKYYQYVLDAALAEVKFNKDPRRAEEHMKRSYFKIVQKEISPSSPENISYLEGFTTFYTRVGKYDSANVMQEMASAGGQKCFGESSMAYASLLAGLAETQLMAGQYSATKTSIESAEKIIASKRGNNFSDVSLSLQLARIHRLIGELDRSEPYFSALKQAENNNRHIPFVLQQEIIGEQAQFYFDKGSFYRAGKKCNEAKLESDAKKEIYLSWLLPIYDTKADVNNTAGNYALAEAALNNAFNLSNDQSFEESQTLLIQSDYLIAISDYSSAMDAVLKADEIRKTKLGEDHFYRYATISQIALIGSFLENADPKKIEGYYLKSLGIISASFGEQNPFYYKIEQNLAEFYLKTGKYDQSLTLLTKELAYWEKIQGNSSYNYAVIKGLLGNVYYAKENYNEAENYYTDASRIYLSLFNDKHPNYLKIQGKLARVYFMEKDVNKSVSIMEMIVSNVMEYSKKYFSSLSFRQRNRFWNSFKEDFEFYTYLMLEKSEKDQTKRIGDLYNMAISTKGILLNSDIKLRKKIAEGKDTLLTQLFQTWLSQKELLTYSLSLNQQEQKDQGISIKAVEQEIEKIEKEMGQRSNAFKQAENKNNINIETVRGALENNEYAIEMVRYRKFDKIFTDSIHYAALIVNKTIEPQLVILNDGAPLEKRFFRYYRNSVIYKGNDEISFEKYWKPIKEKISDNSKIFFSGEGVYNQINIETLKDHNEEYVIDKNQVVYITNTKDIVSPYIEKEQKTFRRSGTFALLGNPLFYFKPEKKHSIFSLLGAEREVNLLEEIALEHRITPIKMLGKDVVEPYVKKINNPRLFHIATHGYFRETQNTVSNEDNNSLLNSGLMLSGSGDIIDGEDQNIFINKLDGILTANEVLDLNFDQTDLVVLSACETGRGEVQGGEGVYGLQRSFLIAGSKAIILSLFKVDDEVTQLLMKEFYSRWFVNNDARASFTEAKRKIKQVYPDPVYWGAFILIEKSPKNNEKASVVVAKRK